MSKITAYSCDFCYKAFHKDKPHQEHMKICIANPKNRACGSCKHNKGIALKYHCKLYPDLNILEYDCESWEKRKRADNESH